MSIPDSLDMRRQCGFVKLVVNYQFDLVLTHFLDCASFITKFETSGEIYLLSYLESSKRSFFE